MSERFVAGHVPFSTYQRSTAELIVALLWALTLALAVSLDTATRGTIIAAMIPRMVTTANNSIKEKPDRLLLVRIMIAVPVMLYVLAASLIDPVGRRVQRISRVVCRIDGKTVRKVVRISPNVRKVI